MKRDMYAWHKDIREAKVKKAVPVLSFPAIQLMSISVLDLIGDSDIQAKAMKLVADRVDSAAAVSLMDLSVEAEAFGSTIRFSEDEVPTVVGKIVGSLEDAESLKIPRVGDARTGIYLDSMEKAVQLITDRPVFGGLIGPFSLAGRLMDVSEAMVNCYIDPDMVHATLNAATTFLIEYAKAYKKVGANGIVIAEPLAGILSPDLIGEFSTDYVKKMVDAVQDENFIVIYHNCGNNAIFLIDSILETGALAFHFGNAIEMAEMMKHIPADKIAMGNVDPAGQFRNGTPETIRERTTKLLDECGQYPNFVISSGCDIPPLSSWENIDEFFATVKDFYQGKS
jgi:uroporphyrinogen decarboxylase